MTISESVRAANYRIAIRRLRPEMAAWRSNTVWQLVASAANHAIGRYSSRATKFNHARQTDDVALFSALPEQELAELAAHAGIKAFPKNVIVVNEGDETDSLYVVLSGRVKIFLADENGREFILGSAGPGEYFGEVALDGGRRSASVMTLEPCRFVVIPRTEMKYFVARHPHIALTIMINLSRRARALTENVKSLALMDVYGRVARLLLDLVREEKGVPVVAEALTQQDIADRVGASRVMINRILKDLTVGGYISTREKKIVIHRKPPAAW